jgi:hypothetical protein
LLLLLRGSGHEKNDIENRNNIVIITIFNLYEFDLLVILNLQF